MSMPLLAGQVLHGVAVARPAVGVKVPSGFGAHTRSADGDASVFVC